MPKKQKYNYSGDLEELAQQQLKINIDKLANGLYELQVIHRNKILLKTTFKK